MKVSKKLKKKIEEYFSNLKHHDGTNIENRYMEIRTDFDDWLVSKEFLKNSADSGLNLQPTSKLIFLNFSGCKKLIDEFKNNFNDYEANSTYGILENRFKFYYKKLRDNFGKMIQEANHVFICPYCQRNYIGIFENEDNSRGYTAPDLDHFYPKSKFPFLAVTISNLIPSCQVCNQRLKRTKDTYSNGIVNPLEVNVIDKIEFYFDNGYIPKITKESFRKLNDKEKEYLELLKIQEQYTLHSEIPKEVKRKFDKYNIVKKQHLIKCCQSLSETIIENIVFHEYKYIDKTRTPLWKLKKDMYEKIVKK